MLKEQDLHGIYVPIITPFDEESEVDAASFYNQAYNLFQDEIESCRKTIRLESRTGRMVMIVNYLIIILYIIPN